MVIDVLLLGGLEADAAGAPKIAAKLDEFGRPKLIFGHTIHDNCPRRGHFENGEFVTEFGSAEEVAGYCLYKLGCKGPQTYTNCPIVRWNNQVSWCVESGSPCIGCGGFNWVDENAPFLGRMRRIGVGSGKNDAGYNPATLGMIAGGVVAGALVVHGFGMGAAGRIGNGAPQEEMKDYDRKRMKKGGDK
jgi:hydrogenase small subunit